MKPAVRVGIGFDFHPFGKGKELRLGGVVIPHSRALEGHSDADTLCHAVADALLGGAGLADLGTYFPDTDPANRGISSLRLLEQVWGLIQAEQWAVANIDIVVIAEEPQMSAYKDAIRENLGRILRLSPRDIGVKATTMEGKGPIGRKEGIAVQAVAMLYHTPADNNY